MRENPGSCAGASSTTFHRYRIDKRIEQERLDDVEKRQKEAAEEREWVARKVSEEDKLAADAERRRAKRLRRKYRQKASQIMAKEDRLADGSDSGEGRSSPPSLPAHPGSKRSREVAAEGEAAEGGAAEGGAAEGPNDYDFLLADARVSGEGSLPSAGASGSDSGSSSSDGNNGSPPAAKRLRAADGDTAQAHGVESSRPVPAMDATQGDTAEAHSTHNASASEGDLGPEALEQVEVLVATGVPEEEAVQMVKQMLEEQEETSTT